MLCCHPWHYPALAWGRPFTTCFGMFKGPHDACTCFSMVLLGPKSTETSFTVFCYKCCVVVKDEFRLMNLKVLVKPSRGDRLYPCCDHTRNSSIWLFSAQNQRDTLNHKNKTSGMCNVLLQLNNQIQKCALCTSSLSRVRLFVTPWTGAHQVPLSIGFSRQEFWSGLPCPSPGDVPNPGVKPGSPALQADSLPSKLQFKNSKGLE